VGGKGDDLDRLSQTINRMLDRMAELVESLREVSANIAHDLKTPLARLRQRLEAAQAQSPDDRKAALEASTAHVDEILATFSALLRIAQIDAGTRRAGFAVVHLSDVFATVAEAFAPAAEDAGQILTASITPDLRITPMRSRRSGKATEPSMKVIVPMCRAGFPDSLRGEPSNRLDAR
jgi:signal transduction histidine kinase